MTCVKCGSQIPEGELAFFTDVGVVGENSVYMSGAGGGGYCESCAGEVLPEVEKLKTLGIEYRGMLKADERFR